MRILRQSETRGCITSTRQNTSRSWRHGIGSSSSSVRDSYIIELKHSKVDASDADLAAKAEEGITQLRRYAADPTVPALSSGTRVHLILYQFKGTDLVRCEEIPQGT